MRFNKVIVTGGRAFANKGLVEAMLNKPPLHIDMLVIGGAMTGVDEFARLWGVKYTVPHLIVPAKWRLGKQAGFSRNGYMLDIVGEIECVLAFPGGPGTADMKSKAFGRGVRVYVVEKDEWVVQDVQPS